MGILGWIVATAVVAFVSGVIVDRIFLKKWF